MATKDFKGKSKSDELNDWLIHPSGIHFPVGGKAAITNSIKPGIWKITQSPEPMDTRLGIKYVGEKFNIGLKKVYKTGGEEICELIEKTWNSGNFKSKQRNLSAFLVGQKGTGKTLAVQLLCNKFASKYPIILVENPYDGGSVSFLQDIDFECIVLIDEAEKVFNERRTDLLKICDGIHCQSSKIILMTANSLKVDDNLIARPGRVRYVHKFDTLSEETCREFLLDNLENKEALEDVFNLVNKLSFSTIDMLTNIVEEYNLHGSIPQIKKYLNIELSDSYIYYAECRGVDNLDELKEVTDYIKKVKPAGRTLYDFLDRKYEEFQREVEVINTSTSDPDKIKDEIFKLMDKYPTVKYEVRQTYATTKEDLTIGTYLMGTGKVVTNPNEDGVFLVDTYNPGGKALNLRNYGTLASASKKSSKEFSSNELIGVVQSSYRGKVYDGEDNCYDNCYEGISDANVGDENNTYQFCIFSHAVDGRKLYGGWNKKSIMDLF